MNVIKDLLVKGRYIVFIGVAGLVELERNYGLPYTRIYR